MNALFRRCLAIGTLALAGASAAIAADSFPTRPIRLVVTSAAGGFMDITARVVAKQMSEKLSRPVIVENRPGAGGLVAIRGVKTAPADGYTLLVAVNTVVIQQLVNEEPGYDLLKDFVGVGPMTRSPYLLLEGPNQPDKSLADLLARAKANPDKLNYASAGQGSTTHLATALFLQRAGVNLVHVPYKGNSAAWPDVISGRVTLILEPYGSGGSMIREGQMKALGSTSTQRLSILPQVPAIAEQVPGYSFYIFVGLFAPAATPKDVVQKLSVALQSALTNPELKNRFRDEGSEVMLMSPDEFTQFLKLEQSTMSKLASDLHLPKQ